VIFGFFRFAWRTARSSARVSGEGWGTVLPGLVIALCLTSPGAALGMPSYAVQTDQPCSACHIGAFGPRLNQSGRNFKLYGFTANDTKQHTLPFSLMANGSFVHTDSPQTSNESVGYAPNNNVTFEALDGYYAGRIFGAVGAFVEVDYDAIPKSLRWEDLDVRYAREARLFGSDSVLGISINNAPTELDLWDSSPAWVFPYATSDLAPAPAAAPFIELLPSEVLGIGAYAMWNQTVYLEGDVYGGLQNDLLRLTGTSRIDGADSLSGPAVYWRLALQHEFDSGVHYIELGTYGVNVAAYPQAIQYAGADTYTDIAADATYQWVPHPELSTADALSAHILFIHEDSRLNASAIVLGTKPSDSLSSFRADVTYAIGATYSPTFQYFRTTGTADAARWMTPNVSPDSSGWIAEIDYIPWGKPDSPLDWLNARIALQYTDYMQFDGTSLHAADYNTLLLNIKLAVAANR
jgi:hypothetical protein